MVSETDLRLGDGRTVHVYDAGGDGLPVVWHHGTPNLGAPPEPLFAAAKRLGLRWVSFDRPGYGGSTPYPGRTLASVASDVAPIVDALGIGRFATVGHSGGGSAALACGSVLGDRVVAVVAMAALAPCGVDGLDWFGGMIPSGVASLRAARAGRAAKEGHEASGVEYDPEFTEADLAELSGDWAWILEVVRPALDAGPYGLIDDDISYVTPWGCDPASIGAPVLLLHGGRDRMVPSAHGAWLASHCPTAEFRLSPDDGHISVLRGAEPALEWLARNVGRRS